MDLRSTYLGMSLASPLVASPSPATGRLDSLLRLEDAGVGAVVLPSLFEEEVESEALTFLERMEAGAGVSGEADPPPGALAHLSKLVDGLRRWGDFITAVVMLIFLMRVRNAREQASS